jgi:hypothetical protein
MSSIMRAAPSGPKWVWTSIFLCAGGAAGGGARPGLHAAAQAHAHAHANRRPMVRTVKVYTTHRRFDKLAR